MPTDTNRESQLASEWAFEVHYAWPDEPRYRDGDGNKLPSEVITVRASLPIPEGSRILQVRPKRIVAVAT